MSVGTEARGAAEAEGKRGGRRLKRDGTRTCTPSKASSWVARRRTVFPGSIVWSRTLSSMHELRKGKATSAL